MAGSFDHVDAANGEFRFNLIENMSDAYEACKMMHFMIRWLAKIDPHGDDVHVAERISLASSAYYDSVNPARIRERAKHADDPLCENCNKLRSTHFNFESRQGARCQICPTSVFEVSR